jgi:hypothetical protein
MWKSLKTYGHTGIPLIHWRHVHNMDQKFPSPNKIEVQ